MKKLPILTANRILTTARKYKSDLNAAGLVDPTKTTAKYMDIQEVVAVGPRALYVEVGNTVSLDFSRYKKIVNRKDPNSLASDTPDLQRMVPTEVYNVPTILVDDVEYFLLGDNDVEYIIPEGGYEEVEESPIVKPKLIVQ